MNYLDQITSLIQNYKDTSIKMRQCIILNRLCILLDEYNEYIKNEKKGNKRTMRKDYTKLSTKVHGLVKTYAKDNYIVVKSHIKSQMKNNVDFFVERERKRLKLLVSNDLKLKKVS